jgi:heme-degrading monooxygenase HmoA
MHARLTTVTGSTDIDKGIAHLRDSVLPQVQQQKGFRGLTCSADRSTGLALVLALWESEADLDASESVADKARGETMKVMGGQPKVERFEQTVWEMGDVPPKAGAKLHVRPVTMDPSRVDENVAFFKETVLPEIRATAGFMSVRQLMNRQSGEGRVGTVWADAETLRMAREKSEQRRSMAAQRGIQFGDDMVLELILVAI